MIFTDAEWSLALCADRGEEQKLLSEIELRRAKLALPLTPARKRVRPRHEAAVFRLSEELELAERRLATRHRILATAGVAAPDDVDDTVATSLIALLRFRVKTNQADTVTRENQA